MTLIQSPVSFIKIKQINGHEQQRISFYSSELSSDHQREGERDSPPLYLLWGDKVSGSQDC